MQHRCFKIPILLRWKIRTNSSSVMGMGRVKNIAYRYKKMKSLKETAVLFILFLSGSLAGFDVSGRNFIKF